MQQAQRQTRPMIKSSYEDRSASSIEIKYRWKSVLRQRKRMAF